MEVDSPNRLDGTNLPLQTVVDSQLFFISSSENDAVNNNVYGTDLFVQALPQLSLPVAGIEEMERAITDLTPITPNLTEFFPTNSPRRLHEDDLNRIMLSPLSSPMRTIEVGVVRTSSPGVEKHNCILSDCPLCPLAGWLKQHVDDWKLGAIYVSGSGSRFPPGTGRRVKLEQLLKLDTGYFPPCLPIFINCRVVRSAKAILCEVAGEVNPGSEPNHILDAIASINEAVDRSSEFLVVLLDHPEVLNATDIKQMNMAFKCIFSNFPTKRPPKMVKVADLATAAPPKQTPPVVRKRTLTPPIEPSGVTGDPDEFAAAREVLQADPEPHELPYSKEELVSLLTTRLEGRGVGHVFAPNAIRFAGAKMGKVSGDARLTLNLCIRALEIAEGKARDAQGSSLALSIPQVHSGDLWRLMDHRGSEYATGLGAIGEQTPLQQKILLASLLLIVKHNKSKDVKLGKLMDTYRKVMHKRKMKPEPEASCVGM